MKIKIVSPDIRHAQEWSAALVALGPLYTVAVVAQALERVNVLVNGSRPDLVVAECLSEGDFAALEALAAAHPELDYILVGADMSPEVLMRAMRAGVREVLPAPATGQMVAAAVQRQARKRQAAAPAAGAGEPAHGQVLAFFSSKGGAGTTFIAANVAHALASSGRLRVALVDLNLQFGDALLMLSNERPPSNVADVARHIQRLDRDLLLSAMAQPVAGLHVLAAPDDPSHAAEVQAEHVKALLALMRHMFDVVVVDAGRSLSAVSLQALDQADRIYPVLQLSLPYVRDAKRLRSVFRSLEYPTDKVKWLVNRYRKNDVITLDDVKRTLSVDELICLPNQYDVSAQAVNLGQALSQVAPHSALAKAMADLARQLVPQAAPDKGRGSWFQGLFRSTGVGGLAATAPAKLEAKP